MSIQVTCPGCLTRFQVSEKFAGKKGPCPKCKKEITIPDKQSEVVIHSPEDAGPKDSQGRSVLKPISRQETRLSWALWAAIVTAVLAAILLAVGLRITGDEVSLPIRVIGAVVVAPALVFAGYTFARDQELEPYRGTEVLIRTAIASLGLAVLWLVYAYVPAYLFEYERAAEASYLIAGGAILAMMVLGALVAVAAFELEFSGGLIVSALYYVSVLGLAVLAGIPLAGL
jgi:hypothetical protein